jgi:cytoskeletal protein RodZ
LTVRLTASRSEDIAMNDDEIIEPTSSPAGDRLRAAREKKGLSLEELASQTRIPLRHLQSLEQGDWSKLPAPTYTIGFAKSYASAVDLDRNEIAEDLRAEMGGLRPDSANAEVFQPADPGRTMPKWLVLAAIGGIILVVILLSWLNERSLQGDPEPATEIASTEAPKQATQAPASPAQQPQSAQANGPVTIAATDAAWIQVKDNGKTLFEGVLNPGQTYQVPPTATAPVLKAGKPEALRITVGSAVAPPVGPPGKVAANVSLAPADLMRGGGGATGATATAPAPSAPPGVQNTFE